MLSLAQGQRVELGDAGALGETVVLNDRWPGSSPLCGVATALDRYRTPLFALAVDAAFPSSSATAKVLAAFPGHDAAVPAVGRPTSPCLRPTVPAVSSP